MGKGEVARQGVSIVLEQSQESSSKRLHAEFMAIVPLVEQRARMRFRSIRCHVTREDKIAECVALAWQHFKRASEQGQDVRQCAGGFAGNVVKAVACFNTLCGRQRRKDVLSPAAQQGHGFAVEYCDLFRELCCADGTVPVPDQAAFHVDLTEFLGTLPEREQQWAARLAEGHDSYAVSREFGFEGSRVTQQRRKWRQQWEAWHGETV